MSKSKLTKTFTYERMVPYSWDTRFKVRTWIKAKSATDMTPFAVQEEIERYINRTLPPEGPCAGAVDLARMFQHLIAAVEVVAANGEGMVIYMDWP